MPKWPWLYGMCMDQEKLCRWEEQLCRSLENTGKHSAHWSTKGCFSFFPRELWLFTQSWFSLGKPVRYIGLPPFWERVWNAFPTGRAVFITLLTTFISDTVPDKSNLRVHKFEDSVHDGWGGRGCGSVRQLIPSHLLSETKRMKAEDQLILPLFVSCGMAARSCLHGWAAWINPV